MRGAVIIAPRIIRACLATRRLSPGRHPGAVGSEESYRWGIWSPVVPNYLARLTHSMVGSRLQPSTAMVSLAGGSVAVVPGVRASGSGSARTRRGSTDIRRDGLPVQDRAGRGESVPPEAAGVVSSTARKAPVVRKYFGSVMPPASPGHTQGGVHPESVALRGDVSPEAYTFDSGVGQTWRRIRNVARSPIRSTPTFRPGHPP
jgi:hypothetical protein